MNDTVTSDTPSPVPWNAAQVLILVFLVLFFWPSVATEVFRAAGFANWYFGEAAAGTEKAQLVEQLFVRTCAFPFQAATVPFLLFVFAQGHLSPAAGLTSRCFARNVGLGIGGALVLTPLLLGLNQAIVWLNTVVLHAPETKHPLARIGEMSLSPLELCLWLFVPIVAAPVIEELLFRGVLQPWAGKTRWGGYVLMGLAAALAVTLRSDSISIAWQLERERGWTATPEVIQAFSPLIFVAAFVSAASLFLRLTSDNMPVAVAGTSLLFAMVHTTVWPTPIALFFLALALGWLKERTGSLVGPIVLHSVFNAVSCGLVLLGLT